MSGLDQSITAKSRWPLAIIVIAIVIFAIDLVFTFTFEVKHADVGVAATTWLLALVTLALVVVVWIQVGDTRKSTKETIEASDQQRRKWATLQACDRYDMDPELVKAVRCLRKYHWYRGPCLLPPGVVAQPYHWSRPPVRPELERPSLGDELTADQQYTLAAGLLLNYFDSIAIGINQKFYEKEICKEHIGRIFVDWMDLLREFDPKTFDRQMAKNFDRLPPLLKHWRR
jgi:hypothetical protein